MRHTHPTTRSHRSPPERPTAHTQASTRTHGRQAVNGPHTHAQPHRHDHHHQPSHRQPTRHTQVSHNHHDHEAPTPEDTSSTTAARPAHNALTSGNTKHHDGEITGDTKTFPSTPGDTPSPHASRPHASYAFRLSASYRFEVRSHLSLIGGSESSKSYGKLAVSVPFRAR